MSLKRLNKAICKAICAYSHPEKPFQTANASYI